MIRSKLNVLTRLGSELLDSAAVLIDEITSLASIGTTTGEGVRQSRMESLGLSYEHEYLAYLNNHLHNLSVIYARMETAGVPLDGLEDLMPQMYSTLFATRTGWAGNGSHSGPQRVSPHLIDKMKFFKTLSVAFTPSLSHDPERVKRLSAEISSLSAFIHDSEITKSDANVFIVRLDNVKAMLNTVPCDFMSVAEQLSSIIGLLSMYASKINDEEAKASWVERIRTASLLLGGDLLVSISTQAITTGAPALLGLTP